VVITNAHGQGRPIYAVRTNAAGDVTGNRAALAWVQERAGNYMPTPLLHEGLAYFCNDIGVLTVYALANGERLYQQRLGQGRSAFSSSPVAAGGRLYATDEDGRTYVLALGREYRVLAENELGENVMASAAVADGVLYIRGRRHLFAVGSK
jgi:outer membrane protein assembly factor BamB